MADGLGYSEGSGKTVLTDDCGAAGHKQGVFLAISADGDGTPIPADATYGLDVDVTRLPALVAGTAYVGKVRLTDGTNDITLLALTNSKPVAVGVVDSTGTQYDLSPPARVKQTPTLDIDPAYTANDSMSTADLEFAGAGPSGIVTGCTIIDRNVATHDGTNGHVIVDLYTGAITPGTANDAYAVATAAEANKYIARIDTRQGGADGAGTWTNLGAAKAKTIFVPCFIPYTTDDDDTLFAALVAARTWAAVVADVTIDVWLHFTRD